MDLTGKDQAYFYQKLAEFDQLKKALCESYQEAVEDGSEEAVDDWRQAWLKHSDKFDFFAWICESLVPPLSDRAFEGYTSL